MNQNCRKVPTVTDCEPKTLHEAHESHCQPFDVCLGLGRSLHFDGYCLTTREGKTVPDGVYGSFVVKNGCIVDAYPEQAAEYTPAPCTPAATPCGGEGGGGGGGGGGGVTPQPGACNLLSTDAAGRLGVFLSTQDTATVQFTGCGSPSDPLRAEVKSEGDKGKTYVASGDGNVVDVKGTGSLSDAYLIGLVPQIDPGQYGGFSINRYGQVTGYVAPDGGAVLGLSEGPGIKLTDNKGYWTIALDAYNGQGGYQLGGYAADIDMYGRIKELSQNIVVPDDLRDVYIDPYQYELAFNEYGSLVGIQPIVRQQDIQFSTMFTGTRDTTQFTFSSKVSGNLRVVYRGTLPYTPVNTGTTTGFTDTMIRLPAPYRMTVDEQSVTAYAITDTAKKNILEVHLLTERVYAAGQHTIEIMGPNVTDSQPYPFQDVALMDVSIVEYV